MHRSIDNLKDREEVVLLLTHPYLDPRVLQRSVRDCHHENGKELYRTSALNSEFQPERLCTSTCRGNRRGSQAV